MSHANVIEKNYDALLRCTSINCYIIDCLKAEDIIDRMQEAKLRAKRNSLKQCDLLFQWLKEVSQDKYESFLQVMNDTEQEHVTNLLTGSSEEDHLPLSEVRHSRLDKIRPKIANVIYIDSEVISELKSLKAISRTDAEDIRAEKVDYAKISKLIAAIMRRSNYSYNSFQEVLRKTLQFAAAQFLCEGEMPAVHLNNKRPDLDGPLSRAFNDIISSRKTDDAEIKDLLADMNGLGLNPVKAITGESIIIFIYCKTVDNAVTFTQLFNSGRLQYLLDGIFRRLILTIEPNNSEEIDSFVSLEDEEIATLEEFTGIEGWKVQRHNGSKYFGRKCGRHATTQTDEDSETNKERQSETIVVEQKRALEAEIDRLLEVQKEFEIQKTAWKVEKYRLLKQQKELEIKVLQNETQQLQMENYSKNQRTTFLKGHDRRPNMQRSLRIKLHLEKLQNDYKLDPVLVQTIRTKASKTTKSIVGFTILDKELFIASDESSEIEVYDLIKYSFNRRCNLKKLIYPLEIRSCNRNKCLYIIDYKGDDQSSEILRVDSNGKLIKDWSTGDDIGWGLSVTDDSNVLLTVYNKNKLNEYSPDGQLIREVNLSVTANIAFPWHAIKLTTDNFLVSNGFYENDELHRVCTVDATGKLKKSFGGKRGSGVEHLNVPSYLSVDRNGFVMVADQENSRVLLLDSNLDFRREILSREKHGLRYATIVVLDESSGRLFVADNGWDSEKEIFRYGRILIFDVI